MTSRRLLLLGVAALLAIATAMILSHQRSAPATASGETLYPALKDELNAVTAVRIFQAGDTRAVELLRKDSQWTVTERSGYAADGAKVRKLLLALAEAKPVEEKTSNPENYATLGVEDTSAATASGARVELDGVSKPLNLIVGKAAGPKGTYVRRAGEPASWLVNESVNASTATHDWLQASIVDVTADRVQSVNVTTEGKQYTASKNARADADFKIEGMPKGKEADAFSVNNLASAFSSLTLADVRSAQDFGAEKPSAHVTMKTFDGLVLDMDGYSKNDKRYVAVKSAYDPAQAQRFHVETKAPATAEPKTEGVAAPKPAADNVEEVAKSTNARLDGWVFEIADYKYDAIFKPLAELTKK